MPRAAWLHSSDIETSTRAQRRLIAFAGIGHKSARRRDGHACRGGDGHKKDEQISHRSITSRLGQGATHSREVYFGVDEFVPVAILK